MASSLSLLLLFSSVIGTLTTTATARPGLPFHPCNTLLVSTYSFSFKPRNTPDDIPNLSNNPRHPAEFFAVVTEVREFNPKPHRFFLDGHRFFPEGPQFRPHMNHHLPRPEGFIRDEETLIQRPHLPFGSSSSLRERTTDILNVIAALLFGAACGALTAGTMYLIWSLFNSRFEIYHHELDGFSDDDDCDYVDEEEEDIFNPKKAHNNNNNNDVSKCVVVVPAPPSVTDSANTALLKKDSA